MMDHSEGDLLSAEAEDRRFKDEQADPTGSFLSHWRFSYSMLHKLCRSFAFIIQQLCPELHNAVGIVYLVLGALDTVGNFNENMKQVLLGLADA